ncbi:MAG: DUF6364 family protein [Microcoleaceae cyanobacterium]
MPSNKPKIQVYLDEDLLEDGKQLAEKRQRSLSSLIRRLLQLEVEKAKAAGEMSNNFTDNSDK